MREDRYGEALIQAGDALVPASRPSSRPSNPTGPSGLEHRIAAIARALAARDSPIFQHQRQVGVLAMAIATEMGLPARRAREIRLAGLVHDVGEIRIPPGTSGASGAPAEDEVLLERRHPRIGHDILLQVGLPWPVAEIVLQHHERVDGSGYPRGLKGGEISLGARIIAVADIVEAIAFERGPSRAPSGIAAALAEVRAREGRYYDTRVVAAALRLFGVRGFRF